MLKGGTKADGICDKCFKTLDETNGIIKKEETGYTDKTTKRWVNVTIEQWVHNDAHKNQCLNDQIAHYDELCRKAREEKEKAEKDEKDEKAKKEALEQKIANEVFVKNYEDIEKEILAKQLVSVETERERLRFEALTKEEQKEEEVGDFFKFPENPSIQEEEIIKKEKIYRARYKADQKKNKGARIRLVQQTYLPSHRIIIVYSVNSINKINRDWQTPNTYSIEIHCTTFRPPNNPNDPSQNFYGHVTLNIHRGISITGGINTETYHYGVYPEKSGTIRDFIRKFWNNKGDIISKPTVLLLDINQENKHLAFLFPQKTAGDLMIEYYNWCIRNCPRNWEVGMTNSYKVLTRWGEE